jgi:hypothetical protein
MMAVATGKTDITPLDPLPMGGYGVDDPRLSQGTNEPLTARCTVLWDDGTPNVVVSADVLGFGQGAHSRIRTGVMGLGVASPDFVLTATHTHNAPALDEGLDPFITYDLEDLGPTVLYTTWLVDKIVALVGDVMKLPRTPCTLEYVVAQEHWSFNREGLPFTETDVPVLVARDADDDPLAVLFCYGTHTVAAGPLVLFDPDFPAQAIKQIEAAFPGALAQFILGPAGDQNPIRGDDVLESDLFGASLGNTVVAAVEARGRALAGPILTRYSAVALPLDIVLEPENIAAVRSLFVARASGPTPAGYVRRHAERMIDLIDASPLSLLETSVPLPVQRWRFAGDPGLTVVFSGGEVVSGYAVVLRNENGGSEELWFAAYANEVPGYIPSDDMLSRPGYAAGIDPDFPGIAGGSMSVYGHLAHFKRDTFPGSGDGVESVYLAHLRSLVGSI